MTIQPPGTVPNYVDPTTLNTGGIAPASGGTSPGIYGDQIDLNFEYSRWSKGATVGNPTYGAFPAATNPVTWKTLDCTTLDGSSSDSDGYFDLTTPNQLKIPTGRAGYYMAFIQAEIGDTEVNTISALQYDSYELRALINSTTVVKLGQFIQAFNIWPVGTGLGIIGPLIVGDVVQFQITSATTLNDSTKFMQAGKFGLRMLGTT